MDNVLLSIVLERIEPANLGPDVDGQVLAACEGLLGEVLDDGNYDPPTAGNIDIVEPPGVYLGDLTVEGFRGIGERRTLPLTPGPGLTLIVGRNGSGMSSFAEAAEMLDGRQPPVGRPSEELAARLAQPAPPRDLSDHRRPVDRLRARTGPAASPLAARRCARQRANDSPRPATARPAARGPRMGPCAQRLPAVPVLQRARFDARG